MGGCVSKYSKSFEDVKKQLIKPPDDTQLFNPEFNPQIRTFKFQGTLTNVKIEGDIEQPIGIHFQIDHDQMNIHFSPTEPEGSEDKTIKWKTKYQPFKFTANQYEIRKRVFTVKLIKNNTETFQSIQINLYKVLTGPVKNAFKVQLQNDKFMRIVFDLKICEAIKIQAKVKNAEVRFNGKCFGQHFNYTLEWVLSENGKNIKKVSTRPSPSVSIPECKQSIIDEIRQNYEQPVSVGENKGKKKHSVKKGERDENRISWVNEEFLSEISFNLTVEGIMNSYVWFHCWKIKKGTEAGNKQVLFRFANFRITLNELLQNKQQKFLASTSFENTYCVCINEQLWSHGTIIGHCQMQLQLTVPHYIKQLYGWVRTEKGIIDTAVSYAHAEDTYFSSESFQKLQTLHTQLLAIKEKPLLQHKRYFQSNQIHKNQTKVISQISKHLRLIPFSVDMAQKETKQTKQLYEKQFILLQLMSTNYSLLLSQNNQELLNECWNFLIYLLKRGEFQLKYLGFTIEQMAGINKVDLARQSGNQNPILSMNSETQKNQRMLKKKVKLSIEFQRLLFSCLMNSLAFGLNSINENDSSVQNGEVFKVLCFMRIPIFRNHLIEQVVKCNDKDYSEFEINERGWLKSGVDFKSKQSQCIKQLQWDEHFYQPLELKAESQQLNEELREALHKSQWVDQISKRQSLFFRFFYLLIQKYEQIKNRNKIVRYEFIPGYKKLVSCLLNEMVNLPLMNYSNSLVKACVVLLKNQDMQEPLLLIIAKKTNFYENSHLIKCLSIYRIFLKHLRVVNKLIPASFCYGVFSKVIKKILLSESANCVAAAIMLIYENYSKFQNQFQALLTLHLLGSKFYSLFYHWSYVVRSAFHHLLILKICQNHHLFHFKGSRIERKLKQNYDQVLTELNDYHKLFNPVLSKKQQSKPYHLKMKHKLWKIKQNQNQINQPEDSLHLKQMKSCISMDDHKTLSRQSKALDSENNKLEPLSVIWPQILDYLRLEEMTKQNKYRSSGLNSKMPSKSQTSIEEEESIPELPHIKSHNKQYTYHESAKYHGAFSEDEFHLLELTERERNQVKTSHQQFDAINSEIRRKFMEANQLPTLPQETYALFDDYQVEFQQIHYFNF